MTTPAAPAAPGGDGPGGDGEVGPPRRPIWLRPAALLMAILAIAMVGRCMTEDDDSGVLRAGNPPVASDQP